MEINNLQNKGTTGNNKNTIDENTEQFDDVFTKPVTKTTKTNDVHPKRHLLRIDTTTNWPQNDLDALKAEMQAQINDMTKAKILEQTDKQLNLTQNEEKKNNKDINGTSNNDDGIVLMTDEEMAAQGQRRERSESIIRRQNENKPMTEEELQLLQNELDQQFKEIQMAEKKKKLGNIYRAQDDLAEMEHMQQNMDLKKLMPNDAYNSSGYIDNNDDSISGSVANNDADDAEAMREEMMKMKQQRLMKTFDRQENIMYGDDTIKNKQVIEQSDRAEIERYISTENKRGILRMTEPRAENLELQDHHFHQFSHVLQNIGVANEHVKKALWNSLKDSIDTLNEDPELNKPNNEAYDSRKSNHRVFPSIDFRNNDEPLPTNTNNNNDNNDNNIDNDNDNDIKLENNEDFVKYKEVVEARISELQLELDQVKSDKQILDENAKRFNTAQTERESQILQLNKKINELKTDNVTMDRNYKSELDKVINSKVQLIEACSKEINDLRDLLKRYNVLVN